MHLNLIKEISRVAQTAFPSTVYFPRNTRGTVRGTVFTKMKKAYRQLCYDSFFNQPVLLAHYKSHPNVNNAYTYIDNLTIIFKGTVRLA